MATAKRFLHNVGMGEIAMRGVFRSFEQMREKQPGMTDLMSRAFADLKGEDFEVLAAEVYAQHLSYDHIRELEQFSENSAIKRFFSIIFSVVESGQPLNNDELMSRFNADELTQILKFAQSDSFIELRKSLPEINDDLGEAGRRLGEKILREYIDRQQGAARGNSQRMS